MDISGVGVIVNLIASVTFPAGVVITELADDSDPLDFAAVRIGDVAMGLNGDLITWAHAVPKPMVLNLIPGSQDDVNLSVIANANTVGKGKLSALDIITATVIYPDGTQITLSGGKMTDAPFGKGISSTGRLKTRTYAFSFQNTIGS